MTGKPGHPLTSLCCPQVWVRLRLRFPRRNLRSFFRSCELSLIFSCHFTDILSRTVYLTTDLNPHACRCTLLTSSRNSVPLNPILTDLTSALLPRLTHQVDVLVFNPPYVETEDEEVVEAQGEEGKRIEKSWAGGVGGMRVTNRVSEQVDVRLSADIQEDELSLCGGSTDPPLRPRAILPRRGARKQTARYHSRHASARTRGRGAFPFPPSSSQIRS